MFWSRDKEVTAQVTQEAFYHYGEEAWQLRILLAYMRLVHEGYVGPGRCGWVPGRPGRGPAWVRGSGSVRSGRGSTVVGPLFTGTLRRGARGGAGPRMNE